MDNLTHTLVGLVAGETTCRAVAAESGGLAHETRRNVLLAVGMIGSNLPDIDLAWSLRLITGDNLAYLLHHRGHTHTLPGCAFLGVVLLAAVWAWLRWRGHRASRRDWQLISALGLVAVLGHLGMDALNSYGVHPFWPLDNRWYYGDAVFIIEPLYWLAAGPLLLALPGRIARRLLGLVMLLAVVVLLVARPSWLPAWAAPLPVVLMVVAGWRRSPGVAAATGVGVVALLTIVFAGAAELASRRVDAIAASAFPSWRTLDAVLTPAPANPLCWDLLLLQTSDEDYVIRQGRVSLAGWLDAADCPVTQVGTQRTAPFRPVAAAAERRVSWEGQFSMKRSRLRDLHASDCRAREMLQFLRAPFIADLDGRVVLGDLRFDREQGAGFAEELLPAEGTTPCRYHVPWDPPRRDLLGG